MRLEMRSSRVAASGPPAERRFTASKLLRGKRRRLFADRRGAAMVEFALAILPVLLTFFGFLQWAAIAYTHLILKHAAFVAARCEAVRNTGMTDASTVATSSGQPPTDDCAYTDNKGPYYYLFKDVPGAYGHLSLVTGTTLATDPTTQLPDIVQVNLDYQCTIPLGNQMVCGGSHIQMAEQAKFPNQGAGYCKFWNEC
jgi:TadE-like protein